MVIGHTDTIETGLLAAGGEVGQLGEWTAHGNPDVDLQLGHGMPISRGLAQRGVVYHLLVGVGRPKPQVGKASLVPLLNNP